MLNYHQNKASNVDKYPYLQAPPTIKFKLVRLSCLSRTLGVSIYT